MLRKWLMRAAMPALALTLMAGVARAGLQDSVNAGATPAVGSHWFATDVGWFYTPSAGYVLNEIDTKFGTDVDGRTVTAVLYDMGPPSDGGTLLRSAGFTPLANTFAGGTFASITLTAGHQYFVGFENTQGLSVNVTADSGATMLDPLRWDFDNSGSFVIVESGDFTNSPMLEFFGPTTAVPEPSTLVGCGIAALVGVGFLRRRKTA